MSITSPALGPAIGCEKSTSAPASATTVPFLGGRMIELHVEPRVSKTWEEFCAEHPPYSIALDGYVAGKPAFREEGPFANFDHHEGVDRLSTRSTCMQVYMAMSLGLLDVFRKDGEPFGHVYVNDADQDTCLAVWLLRHPGSVTDLRIEQPIARLLLTEDILDCTAGAYPVSPNRAAMRQQAWVFQPYFEARTAGLVQTMDAKEMRKLIREVCKRISAHAAGHGKQIKLDTHYEEVGGGPGWRMITEQGPHARTALFAAGVRAFVSLRENGDGTWTYSLGRMSPFVRFPVTKLYELLNEAEGCENGPSGWGGSNTIGGSPREGGSKLPPVQIESLINEHLGWV